MLNSFLTGIFQTHVSLWGAESVRGRSLLVTSEVLGLEFQFNLFPMKNFIYFFKSIAKKKFHPSWLNNIKSMSEDRDSFQHVQTFLDLFAKNGIFLKICFRKHGVNL